jgi:perosamine synthetase
MTIDTRYVPMPSRLQMQVYSEGTGIGDLVRAMRPVSTRILEQAGRLLERHLDGDARVLLLDSGTTALRCAAQVLGLARGDEVVLSTFNCPQVIEGITSTGASPVLCDSDPRSGGPAPESIACRITARTKCIVLTHQFGAISSTAIAVAELARANGINVVDDAAQAFGARMNGVSGGLLGDVGVLSFGRTKPLNCLGGGALIVPRRFEPRCLGPDFAAAAPGARRRALHHTGELILRRNAPFVQQIFRHILPAPRLFDDVAEALEAKLPTKETQALMEPVSAALLAHKLSRLDCLLNRWQERAELLSSLLHNLPLAVPQTAGPERTNSQFVIRLESAVRFHLGSYLSKLGIQTSWVHYPLHRITRFRDLANISFPGAEDLWRRTLILPCRGLDEREILTLASGVRRFFEHG